MNMLDSEMVVADLRRQGYELAGDVDTADTILLNTCSVREQAENKTYSSLGRLRKVKKENPDKIIGVMGCMAQKDQQLIFQRAPYVDLVVGPGQLQQIPGLIEKARVEGGQHTAVSLGRTAGKLQDIRLIRCAIRRCVPIRFKHFCGSKSDVTNFAPTASCP